MAIEKLLFQFRSVYKQKPRFQFYMRTGLFLHAIDTRLN